jgi:hypothetical protein
MRLKQIVVVVFLLCFTSASRAQSEAAPDSSDVFTYRQNIFLKCLFSKGIAEGVALRSYLRSAAWDEFRKNHSERESFDEIMKDADELCSGNRTPAILASSIATLDHKIIPFKLFFGVMLPLPLTLESQDDFDTRVSKLPEHIYDPKISDRDKLQHFFFSAYFIRTLKMNWLVGLLGDAVEIGENLFIIGGADDPRDRHANKDGRNFGGNCDTDLLQLPSMYLTPNP